MPQIDSKRCLNAETGIGQYLPPVEAALRLGVDIACAISVQPEEHGIVGDADKRLADI